MVVGHVVGTRPLGVEGSAAVVGNDVVNRPKRSV